MTPLEETIAKTVLGWTSHSRFRSDTLSWNNGVEFDPRVRALNQRPYEADDLLTWIKGYDKYVEIGLQDADVGFPSTVPPGAWVTLSSGYSYCAPTLLEALERATLRLWTEQNN